MKVVCKNSEGVVIGLVDQCVAAVIEDGKARITMYNNTVITVDNVVDIDEVDPTPYGFAGGRPITRTTPGYNPFPGANPTHNNVLNEE